ncbi:MAG: hemin uptake protein HemP [Alphaproteobacteria bacterium]
MTEKTDATDPRTDDQVVMIDSGTLLQGAREVRIRHGESVYRLILTKLGKLILTK